MVSLDEAAGNLTHEKLCKNQFIINPLTSPLSFKGKCRWGVCVELITAAQLRED